MCMLTYFAEGIQPDTNALMNGALLNDDGHGFAIVSDGQIIVRKGMDSFLMVEAFERMRKKHPEGPAIFHSRWATHGSTGQYNVHPFFVGGDRRTVLAHNGIFPTGAQPRGGDDRSDTRIVAERVLVKGRFGRLQSKASRRRFGRWMGRGNKIAVLTVDPAYGTNGFIVNQHAGEWEDGIWYSNTGYKFTMPPSKILSDANKKWWEDQLGDDEVWGSCDFCRSADSVDPYTLYCKACESCQECVMPAMECLCWQPSQHPTIWLNPNG